MGEFSVDAESIVAEKGMLHQQIFNIEERIARLLSGVKASVGKQGEEYSESLGIRERNRSLMGEIRFLDSILTHYQSHEYLVQRNVIQKMMNKIKIYQERRDIDWGARSIVEKTMNDYSPDEYFGLLMDWHDLIGKFLFVSCGYYEAGREGIPFDEELKKKLDLEKEKLKSNSIPNLSLKTTSNRRIIGAFSRLQSVCIGERDGEVSNK